MPADDPDRAARLLLKALDSLSERDRALVLRNLLTGRVGAIQGEEHVPGGHPRPSVREPRFGMQLTHQVEQPLLVRLPADLHARFRRWATTHGFSMAGVVRGLVERFLDEQEGQRRSGARGGGRA